MQCVPLWVGDGVGLVGRVNLIISVWGESSGVGLAARVSLVLSWRLSPLVLD